MGARWLLLLGGFVGCAVAQRHVVVSCPTGQNAPGSQNVCSGDRERCEADRRALCDRVCTPMLKAGEKLVACRAVKVEEKLRRDFVHNPAGEEVLCEIR
jgi:hypothetical protein